MYFLDMKKTFDKLLIWIVFSSSIVSCSPKDETKNEIEFMRNHGVKAVGMSTIP